jgi:hypothetical protein
MLKTKQMPKNTKKKLKKTKIIGGKNIADITLREKLNFLEVTSKNSFFDNNFKDLFISIDNNDKEATDLDTVSLFKIDKYGNTYIDLTKDYIKYALLCLDDHDNNSYLFLKKNYKYRDSLTIFEDYQDNIEETDLENKADEYYANFQTLVKNLVENIVENKTGETKYKVFKDYMYDIYSDGIILLTVGNDDSAHNLKQYKNNSTKTDITDITEIIDFFKEKKDCLIIKKDIRDTSNENYLYDCMLQIINKLARTLLEKLVPETLNIKGKFDKEALNKAVKAEEAVPQKVIEIREKLKKLINIILNEKVEISNVKHGILLKSLKTIMLNDLGIKKGITFEYVDNIYNDILNKKKIFYKDYDFNKIISSSEIKYNKVINEACNSNRRKESFQHIINAIYDDKNDKNDENINMLKNLSSGINDNNCDNTIDDILKKRSYLISEANIRRLELETAYYINGSTLNLNDKKNLFDDDISLRKFNKYRKDMAEHLENNSINIDTRKKILLEYSAFKDNFNKYIRDDNKLKDIHISI